MNKNKVIFILLFYLFAPLATMSASPLERLTQKELLEHVAQLPPETEKIDLSYCNSINDEILGILGDTCPYLKHVNLKWCIPISTHGLKSLLIKTPLLEELNLYECWGLRSLEFIGEYCPNLKRIILSWCDGITDRDIASIATNCKNLEEIHYAYCMQYDEFSLECYYNITGENIRYLIEGCPQLKCSFWIGIFHQQRLLRSFPRAPQQI